MKFSVKDIFSKCDQIRRKLRIWPHLLKKSLMENFMFCAVCDCFIVIEKSYNGQYFTFSLFLTKKLFGK